MSVSIYIIDSGWMRKPVRPINVVVCLKHLLKACCFEQPLISGVDKIRSNKAKRPCLWGLTVRCVLRLWCEQAESRGREAGL